MDLLRILDGTPEPPIIDLHLDEIDRNGEYNLGTPMYEFQKELTDQIVSLHYPDILKFCETNDSTDLIVKSLEICIDNCMLVSTHPYLLIKHYMPKNFAQKDISRKLSETSGKFNVLKDLMNAIIGTAPNYAKNIGILAKNDSRFFDLVEALVIGCNGNKSIKRFCGNNVQRESKQKTLRRDANGHVASVHVHLLPADGNVQRHRDELLEIQFDVMIVLDGHVDTSTDFVQSLRRQKRQGLCALIRLVPIKTIEHCKVEFENSSQNSLAGKDTKLYKFISSIVCLREFNGNLLPDLFPIYNQKLTYLSDKFFKQMFKTRPSSGSTGWPLPKLPKLPSFSALDVETSLLTEVHFHYTPYDTLDQNAEDEPTSQAKKKKKKTYYESKRLELDYLTNPLKNNITKLIGINSHGRTEVDPLLNGQVLTHNQIMELVTAHMHLQVAERELDSYERQNSPEVQAKVGRRIDDTKLTLASIACDLKKSEERVESAQKAILERQQATEKLREELAITTEALKSRQDLNEGACEGGNNQQSILSFIKNQVQIWKLQDKIVAAGAKIKSKTNENTYIVVEYEKCLASCTESGVCIQNAKEKLRELADALSERTTASERRATEFASKKARLEQQIIEAKEFAKDHEKQLGSLMGFLKETSHLKKRKVRTSK